eukprot:1509657-Pyramimonas_sp.AAC.1
MRPPCPVQRFVAPQGTPPKVPVTQPACVSPTQYSVPWPPLIPGAQNACACPHPVQRFVAP